NLFALSAQKALLGRTRSDHQLVEKSGIGAFEDALANMLIPAKQEIVRERVREAVNELVEVNRAILLRRENDALSHIREIEALSARNVNVVREMLTRLKADKNQLDRNMRRFQTSRALFSRHTTELYDHLNLVKLEQLIARTRRDMSVSLTTLGMRQSRHACPRSVTAAMEEATVPIREIHELMESVVQRLPAEHGLANNHPRKFSPARFRREIELLTDLHEFFIRG